MSGKPQYDEAAVVDAAMEVFWRNGYAAASISDLTTATDLSRSSLYQRFGDKDGLFREVLDAYAERVSALRERLIEGVLREVPDAVLNGVSTSSTTGSSEGRLPGNVHFSFPGCEGDSLLMLLDAQGIECSTGSACSAGVPQPSHVLLALGRDDDAARSSLRFSLGHSSMTEDVDAVVAAIGACVERARAARA